MSDTDLTALNVVAEEPTGGIPQLPPCADDKGWLVQIKQAVIDKNAQGNRSISFLCQVISQGRWQHHEGEMRLFLDGRWPREAAKRLGMFAWNCSIRGSVTDTQQFINKHVIIGMIVAPTDPRYTRYKASWTPDKQERIITQPVSTWQFQPNLPSAHERQQQQQQQQQPQQQQPQQPQQQQPQQQQPQQQQPQQTPPPEYQQIPTDLQFDASGPQQEAQPESFQSPQEGSASLQGDPLQDPNSIPF